MYIKLTRDLKTILVYELNCICFLLLTAFRSHGRTRTWILWLNPFAPGDFAEKRVLKLVEWFSGHCRAIKS